MALYQKKPVIINAVQFTGGSKSVEQIVSELNMLSIHYTHNNDGINDTMLIHTLEGIMVASVGDYIIKGLKGEYYPCKPDIFEQSYESVDTPHQFGKTE